MNDNKQPPRTRSSPSGLFMGVKIAKPAVTPLKVTAASIREAVRAVVTQRRAPKP